MTKYFNVIFSLKPPECDTVVLVGDRYDNTSFCTKEMERTRRHKTKGQEFEVQDNIEVPDWQTFFSNNKNKARLLRYISERATHAHVNIPENVKLIVAGMSENNSTTILSSKESTKTLAELELCHHNEADTMIFAIIQFLTTLKYKRIIIEANDTDIFVLSLYFKCRLDVQEIWIRRFDVFLPIHTILSLMSVSQSEQYVSGMLLSAYAITGCDTVSFIFRRGKTNVLRTCLKHLDNNSLKGLIEDPRTENFKNSARLFFKMLYNRPSFSGDLNALRPYLLPTCKSDIRNLPPTEDAFSQHNLRAAFQLLIWRNANIVCPELPPPTNFGWTTDTQSNTLVPVLITKSARPIVIENTVFCKCKLKKCVGNCSCKKAGVDCVVGCYCERQCINC